MCVWGGGGNCESLKEIDEMACVTPARSSRGQTLKTAHVLLLFSRGKALS